MDFVYEINRLRKEKNAVILAHYYQEESIQEIADYVGDSLGLSQQAAKTNAGMIVFAGVHFMAETAKILNPDKKVVLPDSEAGCSLAVSCPPDKFKNYIKINPNHIVVTYINCSAGIKAMSDIICTSSNAEKIIRSIPPDKKIIFAPDMNLGRYLISKTGRDMLLWNGSCVVHEGFSIDKLLKLYRQNTDAVIIAHPESEAHILKTAGFIGSTTELIKYVKKSTVKKFIVATEAGILHKMQMESPDKILIPAPTHENNTCACSECPYMKMNTMEKLFLCMKDEKPEIIISVEIRKKSLFPLQRMLKITAAN